MQFYFRLLGVSESYTWFCLAPKKSTLQLHLIMEEQGLRDILWARTVWQMSLPLSSKPFDYMPFLCGALNNHETGLHQNNAFSRQHSTPRTAFLTREYGHTERMMTCLWRQPACTWVATVLGKLMEVRVDIFVASQTPEAFPVLCESTITRGGICHLWCEMKVADTEESASPQTFGMSGMHVDPSLIWETYFKLLKSIIQEAI